ncbi:MAG: hypothetical protein U0234_25825 [Sandaracinus sp.]
MAKQRTSFPDLFDERPTPLPPAEAWPACPGCGGRDVLPSTPRGLERWVAWLGIGPYTCRRCARRFVR